MHKKSELWLAFSQDELTCSVTVNVASAAPNVEVILNGIINQQRAYVWDLIMCIVDNSLLNDVALDVTGLQFFSGQTVNDAAIDFILRFVREMQATERNLRLTLEEGCVKQVLVQSLPQKKFQSKWVSPSFPQRRVIGCADGRQQAPSLGYRLPPDVSGNG